MPILQDAKILLGDKFDESMQYSIVPTYRVQQRINAGWQPVGNVIENGSELVQIIARKKSRQLLEQEKVGVPEPVNVKVKEEAIAVQPASRFPPSRAALLQEMDRKLKLHDKGLYEGSEEEIARYRKEVEGVTSGKIHMGSTRKRVPRRRRDRDAPGEGGAGRRLREDGGADRPPKKLPVLPEGDETGGHDGDRDG